MQPKTRRGMIGKSLRERHGLNVIDGERAVAIAREMLASHAKPIVEVRAQDPRMIACVVASADEASVRLCRRLGFDLKPGGAGVFGLLGTDAARLFPDFSAGQRAWLETPCGPRETKMLLLAGGTALFSLETKDGKVVITPA